ncbi:hypothetical protein [Epilithonimonas sp. UC225_85]
MKTAYPKKRKAIREYRMFELKWMMIHMKRIPLKIKHDIFGNVSHQLKTI